MDVYLVEDELFAREELKYMLLQNDGLNIVGEAEDIHEAMWEINELRPYVVFLDIGLAKGTGLDLAKQLKSLKNPPFIVFATAYDEYAVDAFDLDAIDYLVKPFNEKRVIATVKKLMRRLHTESSHQRDIELTEKDQPVDRLVVNKDEKFLVVDTDEIVYIGTENRQVFIKTMNKEHLVDIALYEIEEKLYSKTFIRVHRGYIVNLNHVSEIERWFNGTYNLKLHDGSKVPVSRSYIKDIRAALRF
ncbi:LytR/AlgR family response regulator transcription factor [Aquibacillus albus]|uniref:Two-component system response regulator LytT n=1 Tax=Aquibacillus albus TaxID=1168171 RepID=A0ABS2MWB1_9BACI|nr:LytTR family DNA-binding domain-containing protein [Aquibacillus albus]MBM7570176.1 two-component system response regulator LytT [Aquibacillus albus]